MILLQSGNKNVIYRKMFKIVGFRSSFNCSIQSLNMYSREINIDGIVPEGRVNRITDLQETKSLRLLRLTEVSCYCS